MSFRLLRRYLDLFQDQILDKVLDKLRSVGLRVRRDKCNFMQNSIEFLGYLISKDKVTAFTARIQALLDTPQPRNESEARGFLRGLVMLRRFQPNDC